MTVPDVLAKARQLVDLHGPVIAPGWAISVELHEFEDYDPVHVGPAMRADISIHNERQAAFVRVDPRTDLSGIEPMIVHELAHILTDRYDSRVRRLLCVHFAEEGLELGEVLTLEERTAWLFADAYLRAWRTK